MNERERLIELMTKAENENLSLLEFEKKILADYLLENGVVVLPCNVGSTVWYIIDGRCKDVRIENVHQWVSGFWKFDGFHGVGQHREGYEFDLKDFGKTVFLTKEEAEQTLSKRKELIIQALKGGNENE